MIKRLQFHMLKHRMLAVTVTHCCSELILQLKQVPSTCERLPCTPCSISMVDSFLAVDSVVYETLKDSSRNDRSSLPVLRTTSVLVHCMILVLP